MHQKKSRMNISIQINQISEQRTFSKIKKDHCIMTQESILQENVTVTDVYASNERT